MVVGGVWMLVLAALMLSCSLCSGLFYLILPLTASSRSGSLESNVVLGAAAGFGLLFGLLLAWQGGETLRGHVSVRAARVFPPVIVFAIAYIGAIILGLGALALAPVTPYAFPPFHLIAASLPPLALLAYAARRLGAESGLLALTAALGWGALAATALAFLFEAIVGLILIVLAALVVSSLPDSRALLDQLQAQLELAQRSGDLTPLSGWMNQPAVTASFLFYFALIVPPLEEAVKTLIVALIDPRRTRPGDALLWGLSAGAGFAIVENLFNTTATLVAWAPLMVLRAGASVIQVANGALMGRGWYAARVENKWGSLAIAYMVSVVFHALWNGAAIFLGLVAPGQSSNVPVAFGPLILTGVLLILLMILAAVGLAWIVYSVYGASQASVSH